MLTFLRGLTVCYDILSFLNFKIVLFLSKLAPSLNRGTFTPIFGLTEKLAQFYWENLL